MSLPGKSYGDQNILAKTKQLAKGGSIVLETSLPSGRLLKSEAMAKANVDGKVLISWCDAVRAQIDADNKEKEEEHSQKRQLRKQSEQCEERQTETSIESLPEDTKSAPTSSPPEDEVYGPSPHPNAEDPLEYATTQYEEASRLESQYLEKEGEYREKCAAAGLLARKWHTVLAELSK